VVEDDVNVARMLRFLLEEDGREVTLADTASSARGTLAGADFDLVVTDLKLPDGDGLEVVRSAKEVDPELPVLMMTAFATVKTAVEAMKLGAFDYLTKPFDNERLRAVVNNALRLRDLASENTRLRQEQDDRFGLAAIVGSSPAMQRIRESARLAAGSDAAVMIQGETGTGKELVAHAIHLLSTRRSQPFVTVNCGAIPENLVESELFGHKKGSFTGAIADRIGKFAQADTGTIFLDEVTEMKKESQVKLLRAIEAKEVQLVGAAKTQEIDVRVISATNREPGECIKSGQLREDLYYRLNVFMIRIPPLREHLEDAPELVARFLRNRGYPPELASTEVLDLLRGHDFPGNVRELQNVLESGLILGQGTTLKPEHIADRLMPAAMAPGCSVTDRPVIPDEGVSLEEVERNYLAEVLRKTGGNRSQAARLLDISRATLLYRMKKYGLS
jgi:DNA-binding NtrC family response regulator